jgi:hypothetical protein
MSADNQNLEPVKIRLTRLGRENSVFILFGLAYLVIVYAIAKIYHLENFFRLDNYFYTASTITGFNLIFLFIGYLVYLVAAPKIKRPLTHMIGQTRDYFTDWPYLIQVLIALFLIPLISSLFTSLKSMIPGLVPYYLDETFMQIDKAVHFGNHPWQLTHALFGDITSTLVINFIYHFWFFLLWGFLFWHVAFNKNMRERMRFILSFVLSWFIIGNLLALIFSSAGPVYYADITGLESPFAPLMDKLHVMDAVLEEQGGFARIWALNPQQMLWENYTASQTGVGAGISAMPSMHLAIAMLMTLSAFTLNRVLGYFMVVFLAATLVGSVHLGWHYAIDGYVSIAIAFGIWKISAWLVGKTFQPS